MAHQPYYPFQYAQLPTYGYQTFDRNAISFSFHPIIPPERLYPSNPFADDQMKNEDAPPSPSEDNADPPRDTHGNTDGKSKLILLASPL